MRLKGMESGKNAGFSLIELMIVVAILGLVAMVAIPSISNTFRFSVQSTGRELATLIKDAGNSAQITGKVHRVVYDLKNQQYWVESSSETTLLKSDESIEQERKKGGGFFRGDEEDEKNKKNGGFRQENLLTKKKRSLAVGVSFKDVYTEQSETPISEGLAYTHIFPNGLTEKTLVHLRDSGENEITLVVSNLLGRCSVEGRYVEPKEHFKK